MKIPTGVIHGRFQLLHIGHISDLFIPVFEQCDKVVVGICNPEPELTKYNEENPHRSEEKNNPFTFWDRLLMIENSLIELGISRERFVIVPFPINYPEKIQYYSPKEAVYFLTVYDEWGKKKQESLQSLGLEVKVLNSVRPISGQEIRAMIRSANEKWKQYVPNAVVKLIEGGLIKKLV